MKKIYLLVISIVVGSTSLFSQNVNVSGALVGNGTYATLGAAFTAINAGSQTGATILVDIAANTTEAASAVLNQSAGPWASLTISPSGGISRTVSGNIAGHLVDLNGADNVTIDGGASKFLTFDNSNTGSSTSTIRFVNDATNNTITQTNINGSAGNALGTGFGVIYFAAGTTTGNDNNTISTCNIAASSGGTPLNGIYSLGSSASIDNSGNTITVCNISDFFSATTASNGMNINSFNSGWTITNNSFYQTTNPRTATVANTYNGITIASGNGYTVSNNIIGGATPSAGGAAWGLTGTIAVRFIAINMTTVTGSVSSVQNNTFTNFTLNTSSGASTTNGVICGINLTSTGDVNVGTITGNTIGSTSGVDNIRATPTTAGGLVVGIHSSSTGSISIQNNSIGALTCSGITAAISGSITAINVSGAAANLNISNNTIGNSTTDNLRGGTTGLTTGSSLVSGINIPATTSPVNIAIANNTIRNLTSYGTGASGFVRGIQTGLALNCTSATVTGNTIFNLTSNNANVSVSNAQLAAQGIYYNIVPSSTPDISNNTIYNIALTNTGLLATNVAGISVSNATANTITKNKIYGLSNASTATSTTAPGTVSGIHIRGVNTTMSAYNNMISLGSGLTTNTAFIGIWYQGGGSAFNALLYYNSVNIEGTAAAGAQPSFGFYRGNFSTTAFLGVVDIRNNIFNNTRSGGTGTHIAIANNYGATASATGWVSGATNNNVLNAASAANVGWWTTAQTFASWKTTSSGDGLSVSGVAVPFTATPTADLHLSFGVTPTQIESGGVAISGITTDYDNQVRPGPAGSINGGAMAPDIGADEIDAVPLDLFAPTITYSLLLNNSCATTRTFTATISDNSNVNGTIGTRPRVYYKKSTDANNFVGNTSVDNGWKWVEASNASSPFSFTIDYSIINGGSVTLGDVIQYFVVAQDLSPAVNVAINSGTFFATPATVALTAAAFPIGGTINSYSIVTGLSTSLTVGASGTYTSLTGAGGLFSAINANGLTGNTTVNILDPSVVETGAVALNQIQSGTCGLSAYTLLIKPNAATTSTLTGSLASNALIRILSSNVTIDGSNNGTTSRDLTITNTTVTSPSVLLIGSTGTVPVTGTTLKNTIIINGANTATAVVVSDGATLGSAGYFNNITIQNNSIRQSFIGIYNIAVSASGNGSGLLITGNDLNTAGVTSIRLVGVYVQGVDGATVSNNNIGNMANTLDASNLSGIWFATGTVNSTISGNTISTISGTSVAPRGIALSSGVASANINVTGNTISTLTSTSTLTTTGIILFTATSGVQIQKNSITNIKNTNVSGFGANGIQLASTLTAAATVISNNFISDVAAIGFAGSTSADNGYGIIAETGGGYNIDYNSINMNTNQTTVTGLPAAINITSGITTAGSVNIRDNIFANNQTVGTDRYAIFSSAANTVFGTIDYNDYYTAGPNLGFIGSNRANLAAIQTGFGGNTNSLNVQPNFTSATDLHLVAGTNCRLDGYGTPIGGITTDYDGATRDASAPDMGADEFTTSPTPSTMTFASNCDTKNVSPSGTLYLDGSCNLIAKVLPSGGSAVSGKIKTCTTLDVTQQYFNAQPYAQRHYDVEPTTTPSTATGTLTLYFSNTEFVNYNTNNPVYPALPTSALGNADPNRANVRITQFHGVGVGSPTTPGNYPGSSVLITPGAANVFWNGSFWEVTFTVTGFSGFYLHTTLTNAPLPIVVNYLTGRRQGSNHLLNWKVTCTTSPRATMTLERSSDGRNYSGIYNVTADAVRCQQPFDYIDANPLKGMNYYRLKIVDADGKVTYSTTVALLNAVKGFDIISIAPNPVVSNNFKLNVASALAGKMEIVIFDMQGRLVNKKTLSLIAGFNSLPVNVANLSSGTYTIKGSIADDQSKVIRFVKE
jgi:hypothetical protein